MISRVTPSFRRSLAKLSDSGQEAVRRSFRLFMDLGHNSLSFKKLSGHADLWSVRVSLDVRAVGHRNGQTVTWVWVGTHAEFDKLFG